MNQKELTKTCMLISVSMVYKQNIQRFNPLTAKLFPLVSMVYIQNIQRFNPLTAKLFSLNFHLIEVVSRWRDPQLQVSENYSDLTK